MNYRLKKRLSILIATLVLGTALGMSVWYYRYATPRLYEFSFDRDMPAISRLFNQDWYWLIPGNRDSYSPEEVFRYRAPHQNPLYAGRLAIKVMRQKDQLIGFVAYYMKNPTLGFLNFVVVDPAFRGKQYAEKMVQYAVDDMIKRGAKKITLITRPSNQRARKLYKRLGFTEVREDDTFVYIERDY
jgi:ribosomal protein S18 acetylase RimI-like enzyme